MNARHRYRTLLVGLLLCLTALPPIEAAAQQSRGENRAQQVVTVPLRRSRVVDSPWPVRRVAVTDPQVADVQVLSPRQVLVQGRGIGSTDLILWGDDDQTWQARVDVDVDVERLRSDLAGLLPDSRLDLRRSQETIVVTGILTRLEHAQQLHKFLEAAGVRYVDMSSIAGTQQVMIKVRVAEVSRRAMRSLGVNLFVGGSTAFGGSQIGSSAGPINPMSVGPLEGSSVSDPLFAFTHDLVVSPSVTLFGGLPQADLEVFVQALSENQYLRVLAEPNLVALSGEEATFLAGGEFPIPVVQGTLLGGGTSITVEYKEFGVRLSFRPVVLGDNTIQLFVAPEVSELSDVGAVSIEGFQIPSLMTRRAATTVQLKSQQTFAMAGLLQRTNTARSSRVPGLGDLPVLGALFRSVRYSQGETELLVLVTASLVEPLSVAGEVATPGCLHVPPDDWELYCLGEIEGRPSAKLSQPDADWMRQMGLNKLKGPGAWARHGQAPAVSRSPLKSPQAAQKTSREGA